MTQESRRVSTFGTTIFAEFSRLAAEHGAVNLGQGFPDFDGPEVVKAAARAAIDGGVNQYAVSSGALSLRRAIAAHAARFYGQRVDPDSEVVVTSGATEAIFDTVMAFVDPGDEVVLLEPTYDSYLASVLMAGGVPRFVELHVPDPRHATWWLDEDELAAAFSPRTRLVFVNTPHNPTGKVFTADELALIGRLAARVGALVVADEVYEHLVFAPARHVRAATLPGLEGRTITLSSGGKSFSFTGWKVGWAIAPAPLAGAIQKAHQWVTFATASPLQAAVALALALPDAYFAGVTADYGRRRDKLAHALARAGLTPFVCEGTYFLMARTDAWRRAGEDDLAFCRRLTVEHKVAAIPPSVFYGPAHAPAAHGLARFAFCKSDLVLDEAARRLEALGAARS
jgi:N-succinyldiaminopimelate aminotransferase